MTLGQRIANLDPRYGLQCIMQSYASVDAKTDTGYVKKVIQEEFLNAGVIVVGSFALGTETCCLVADWVCKIGKNCMGLAQYASSTEWLARSKEYLSHRPPTGERIEKIVSRTLAIIGTLLGCVLVFWDRGEWVIKLHQDLKLYSPTVTSSSLASSEQEERAPPAPPRSTDASSEAASAHHSEGTGDLEFELKSPAPAPSAAPSAEAEIGEDASAVVSSSAPPPPPMPSLNPAAAAASGEKKKKPRVRFDSKYGKTQEGHDQVVVTLESSQTQKPQAMKKAGTIRTQFKNQVPVHIQSAYIQKLGDNPFTEGFKIKGEVKLWELFDKIGLIFEVEDDELEDTTLDSYIHTINYQNTPKVGTIFQLRPKEKHANFSIEILEASNKTVERVRIKFVE